MTAKVTVHAITAGAVRYLAMASRFVGTEAYGVDYAEFDYMDDGYASGTGVNSVLSARVIHGARPLVDYIQVDYVADEYVG